MLVIISNYGNIHLSLPIYKNGVTVFKNIVFMTCYFVIDIFQLWQLCSPNSFPRDD